MVLLSSIVKVLGPSVLKINPRLVTYCYQVYRGVSESSQPNNCSKNHIASSSSPILSEKVNDQLVTDYQVSPARKPDCLDDVIPNARLQELGIRTGDALDICNENVSDFVVPLQPTTTFAAYVNNSPTLQELVKLDVQLWMFEKDPELCNYILGLNYDRDIKRHLLFLHSIGIPGEKFGTIITKNPLIFKQDLDNLRIRVNYLESKRFTSEEIVTIITRYPNWLSRSTQEVDSRLGFVQQTLDLTGREVRIIAVSQPRTIFRDKGNISVLVFSLKEEMGFTDEDIKSMVVAAPNLLKYDTKRIIRTFNELHNNIGIPHELIVKQPQVLTHQPHRIHCRHLFLKFLRRDQYDPKKENYISLPALIEGSDAEFCKNVAKSSNESYNTFQKTL